MSIPNLEYLLPLLPNAYTEISEGVTRVMVSGQNTSIWICDDDVCQDRSVGVFEEDFEFRNIRKSYFDQVQHLFYIGETDHAHSNKLTFIGFMRIGV